MCGLLRDLLSALGAGLALSCGSWKPFNSRLFLFVTLAFLLLHCGTTPYFPSLLTGFAAERHQESDSEKVSVNKRSELYLLASCGSRDGGAWGCPGLSWLPCPHL